MVMPFLTLMHSFASMPSSQELQEAQNATMVHILMPPPEKPPQSLNATINSTMKKVNLLKKPQHADIILALLLIAHSWLEIWIT
jgi:hypothetical protein